MKTQLYREKQRKIIKYKIKIYKDINIIFLYYKGQIDKKKERKIQTERNEKTVK